MSAQLTDRRAAERLALLDRALDAVDMLLRSVARQGLQRLTESSEAEIRATGQRARFGGLIRLERQLEGLATLAERYRSRDPLFRTGQFATALNRAWLLAQAIRAHRQAGREPDVSLLGELRRSYLPVAGALDVVAIAAIGWVTDSDFVGITVHFATEEGLLQASNAKPCMYFGRDPSRLLWQPLSEHVPIAVADLAHGAFALHEARVSADGRLSIHRDLRIEPAPPRGRLAYSGVEVGGWGAIVERLRAGAVDPLGGADATMVFVEPHGWGPVSVDDTTARLRQPLTDGSGARMWIDIPLAAHTSLLVDNLRALRSPNAPRPDGLVGRATVAAGELRFEPHTAVFFDAVELRDRRKRRVHEVHLGLERLPGAER
ncbi:MAG: hypothetical protein ACI9K2_005492 [Myxococcota bacterium]|jgi:hypothetical protein